LGEYRSGLSAKVFVGGKKVKPKRISYDFSLFWLSKCAIAFVLLIMCGVTGPGPASANEIDVHDFTELDVGLCNFREAIEAHNTRKAVGSCAAGDGDDLIMLDSYHNVQILNRPVTVTNGKVTIKTGQVYGLPCAQVLESAYLTIEQGASVTLIGVGFDANGSFQRSVIENDGGELTIKPVEPSKQNLPPKACRFSNEKKGPPVVSGGILVNRNGGTTVIKGADFVDSSARPFRGHGSKGGAINIVDGSVTIGSSFVLTRFANDTADLGGAIFVDRDATLNIDSNDFQFIKNRAGQGGGAIFSNGVVNIDRGTGTFKSASFTHNHAQNGGAIYSDDGQLSVDGVEFDHNESDNDGGAVVSNERGGKVASIKNSYLHNNSAKNRGGAIYVVEDSGIDVRRNTFLKDRAGPQGGGIYVAPTGNVKVGNSTFVGSGLDEGVVTNDASGEVVFSTLNAANLASFGAQGQVSVSNSILHKVACGTGVFDDGDNLQFLSTDCPISIPTMNPALDPRGLTDNGGLTPTIALLKGSPAIDMIPYSGCVDQEGVHVTIDQRGFPRPDPEDGPDGPCDIGAYESGGVLAPGHQFAGTPGATNCNGKSVSALSNQYGTLDAAASALGYPSVKALQTDIKAHCAG
jgi:predicted outer membrane repeat protein